LVDLFEYMMMHGLTNPKLSTLFRTMYGYVINTINELDLTLRLSNV